MTSVGGVDEAQRKKVEEIIGGMSCPKDFQCAASGFEILCKAKDWGLEGHLECLEPDSRGCLFAVPFGHDHFCNCPVRVYLAKNLNKSR